MYINIRNIKKENGGFTLVELVISVAIMSIIILVAGQFMVSSANSYSSLQRSVSLSQESKEVMEQMTENSLDSSAAVVCQMTGSGDVDLNNPIYFVEYTGKINKNDSTGESVYNTEISDYQNSAKNNLYYIHAYRYNSGTKKLEYGELSSPVTINASLDNIVNNYITYETLCENIDNNGVKMNLEMLTKHSDNINAEVNFVHKLEMTLDLKKRNKSFNSVNNIYFRGRTVYASSFKDLAEHYKEEVDER